MQKPPLAIDKDDILLNFYENLFSYHNKKFGTSFTFNDITSFDLSKVWNCPGNEAIQRVFDFYASPEHAMCEPIAGAIEAIRQLKEHYTLFVVTARPHVIKDHTIAWLDKYFPDMFEDVQFANQFGDGHRRTKLEICQTLNACALIDDSLENAELVSRGGIPVYLLDKPWNQGITGELVTRVFSWEEIVEKLNKKV